MARFRAKLTASVLPVVLIGFTVSTAVAVASASQTADRAASTGARNVTAAAAARIDTQTRSAQQAAISLGAMSSNFAGSDRTVLQRQLLEVLRNTRGVIDTYACFVPGRAPGPDSAWRGRPGMTQTGRFFTVYLRQGAKEPFISPYDDKTADLAITQEWFTGPRDTGGITTSEPYVDPGSHILMTSFTYPITDAERRFIGSAGVDLPLGDLTKQVANTTVGRHGYEILLSAEGIVLAAPPLHGGTASVIGKKSLAAAVASAHRPAGSGPARAAGMATTTAIAARAAGGSRASADPFGIEPALITWTTIPSTGWTLITVIPKTEINAPVMVMRNKLWITSVAVLLLVAGLVIAAAARLTRKLPQLRDAALQIAEGSLDVDLPAPGRDELGEVFSAFGAIVTSLRAGRDHATQFAHVRALADADELTGIPNRRHFFAVAEPALSQASGEGAPLLAMMIDIDHFKRVNDTYGHPTGDDVIQAVAARLAAKLRPTDLFCRYGGEEFAALLPGARPGDDIPERLRAAIADEPVQTRSGPLAITISIGLAGQQPGNLELTDLLARADQALYRAKESGRNCVLTA